MNCVVVDGTNYVVTESMFVSEVICLTVITIVLVIAFVISSCYKRYLKYKYPLDKVCSKDACDSK